MTDFFISDLHLQQERKTLHLALDFFLENQACQARRLYILGDLFDYWLGDDAISPYQQTVLEKLKNYAQQHKVYFMRGNRDFLIGKDFACRTGIVLLDDPTIIESYGRKVLLCHGDLLCTADSSYLIYRKIIQHSLIKRILKSLPFTVRSWCASYIRKKSAASGKRKQPHTVDVTAEAVSDLMRKHQVTTLIHGHTHKPGRHLVSLSKQTGERIVLGDWEHLAWYVKIDAKTVELAHFSVDGVQENA